MTEHHDGPLSPRPADDQSRIEYCVVIDGWPNQGFYGRHHYDTLAEAEEVMARALKPWVTADEAFATKAAVKNARELRQFQIRELGRKSFHIECREVGLWHVVGASVQEDEA